MCGGKDVCAQASFFVFLEDISIEQRKAESMYLFIKNTGDAIILSKKWEEDKTFSV